MTGEASGADDALPLRAARDRYLAAIGLPDGGYDRRWVVMRIGPVPAVVFPNTKARVRAVRYHDLHHLLTGYRMDWTGESEIGAWEVATGCADHWPAWILNLYAFAIGLVVAPRRVFRSFVRGRRSANLYRVPYDDALLDRTVREVRRELRLDAAPAPVASGDVAAFAFWAAVAALAWLGTAALPWAVAGVGYLYGAGRPGHA